MRGLILTLLLMVLPYQLEAITATNHDKKMKPTPIAMEEEEILQTAASNSSDLGSGERQRRLIPYMTFYLTRNFNRHIAPQNDEQPRYQLVPQKIPIYQDKYVVANYHQPKYLDPASVLYQPKITYTPFLETNKLPGGFTPMRAPQPIRVQVLNSPPKEPNYSTIFDKLLHLKQIQKPPQYIQQEPQYQNTKPSIATQYFTRNYATPRPPTKFITVQNYQPETRYKINPPAKTYIHTYTPATIDISNDNKVQNYENFESLKTYNQIPAPLIEPEQAKTYQNYEETSSEKENYEPVKYQNYQKNNEETHTYEPVSTYQTYRAPIEEQKKYEPVAFRPVYRPPPVKAYQPIYHQQEMTQIPQTENPNSLSLILKQLQQSNTLPHTLTPDNIDNSIKTLVQILNALKQTEKFQRPIVVTETEDTSAIENEDDYEDGVEPSSVSQEFPANTPEGGTPGKPGIDYPAYSLIPQTDFSCKKQRYKGFFGDPATSCQVWHYCDLNGGQASFLCPNGTIFSQVALTCDWWYNVKCATTTQLYVLNERLYKYILPFTPKFPEDYSGPLVDRYLALKFAEMEEKMKKQKKGKTEKPTDDAQAEADANKLEDIQSETESASVEHTTVSSEEEINK